MSDPFLGEIRLLPYNFAPKGWAFCSGQLLPINQNQALFSLLGTTYGGDGRTTFALPDLRGRVPISSGTGPGLSNYALGEQSGSENNTITVSQLPSHSHPVQASAAAAALKTPAGAVPGKTKGKTYDAATDGTVMDPATIGPTGGGQPFRVVQPLLTLNFCIALQGIFPSRS